MTFPGMILVCGLGLGMAALASAPEVESVVSPDFALLDQNGRQHQLSRADAKGVVLFFTANGCPVARQSIRPLEVLEGQFQEQGIEFWMVNSNSGDDRESIRREAEQFGIRNIPILLDETQGVAAYFNVQRTGTTILIDTATRRVIYQGALDDRVAAGGSKPAAKKNYLEDALRRFVAGEKVETPRTAARGCLIFIEKEEVSYTREVAPVLQEKCVSCHSPGNIGPFSLSSHRKVRGMS